MERLGNLPGPTNSNTSDTSDTFRQHLRQQRFPGFASDLLSASGKGLDLWLCSVTIKAHITASILENVTWDDLNPCSQAQDPTPNLLQINEMNNLTSDRAHKGLLSMEKTESQKLGHQSSEHNENPQERAKIQLIQMKDKIILSGE